MALTVLACRGQPAKTPGDASATPDESVQPLVSEARPLEIGEPLLRDFATGQSHVYPIELAEGDFLDCAVDQRGLDVVLTLEDSAGKVLLEVDAPTGDRGAEELLAIAGRTGSYVLRVRAYEPGASGRYELTLVQRRPATDDDRARAGAAWALARAGVLRRQGGDSVQPAIEHYERALRQFRELGDREGEANALNGLGRIHRRPLGQLDKSLDYYRAALPIFGELGDLWRKAMVAHRLGELELESGRPESAVTWLEQALELRETLDEATREASTARQLGRAYKELGRPQEALVFIQQAIELWQTPGQEVDLARALSDRGLLLLELGALDDARDDFDRALATWQREGSSDDQAQTLVSISQVANARGDAEQTLEYLRAAQALLDDGVGNPRTRALVMSDLGLAYTKLGKTAQAQAEFHGALEIYREQQDRHAEGIVLHNLGWVRSLAGKPCEALDYLQQAQLVFARLFGEEPTTLQQATTLVEIANAERGCGNPDRAREAYGQGLATVEMFRSRPTSLDQRASLLASLHGFFDAYVDLLMDLHTRDGTAGHDVEALAVSERARARSLLDSLVEVGTDFRSDASPALIRRERELSQWLAEMEASPIRPASLGSSSPRSSKTREVRRRSLLRELAAVRDRIRRESPRYAALTQPEPLSVAEIQRDVLDDETLLLEYDLGKERSYLWVVSRQSVDSFVLPGRAELEDLALRTHRLLARSHQRRSQVRGDMLLAQLSEILVEPIAARLERQRLLVVAEGALQYIPFAALYRPCGTSGREPEGVDAAAECPAEPLVLHHEIVTMPSASALGMLRRSLAGRPPAPHSLAILADPVFREHDPRIHRSALPAASSAPQIRAESQHGRGAYERLAYSGYEAEAILRTVPDLDARAWLGFEATREAVVGGALGEYRILHFATHGVLDEQHPGLSKLVMSLVDERGVPRDNGFVFGHEIYGLRLPAELVVLSACQTALGKRIRGEGLIGLTRGFLYAGAARVVVSLWNVNDRATADLMARFYETLLEYERGPAESLRLAQVKLRAELPAPYYWAGFVIQGEWRELPFANL